MAYTLFTRDSKVVDGPNFLLLQEGGTAPTTATATSKWTPGTGTTPLPRYSRLNALITRTTSDWVTPEPTTGPTNSLGDAFRTGRYYGTFANTNWTFALDVIGSGTNSGSGRIDIEVYKSANANGTSATKLNGSTIQSSTFSSLGTTAVNLTASWSPGATVVLAGEFLFFVVTLVLTTQASTTARTVSLRIGSANTITTPNFTAGKLELLTDDFSAATVDITKWPNAFNNFSIVSGQAQLRALAAQTGAGYSGLTSVRHFDLTASYLYGKFSTTPATGTHEFELQIFDQAASNNYAAIFTEGPTLVHRLQTAGTNSDTNVTYNSSTHAWWRIQESGGNILFDTAPDVGGTPGTWTNRKTIAKPAWITDCYVVIQTGHWQVEVADTVSLVDNVNLTPGLTFTDPVSGTITLGGTRTETYQPPVIYTEGTRSGTITLSGTRSESWSVLGVNSDSVSGQILLSGTVIATHQVVNLLDMSGVNRTWGVVREYPLLRLNTEIITPNGRHYRWASDEPRPENIPSGLRLSSTMPGGFESSDCTLPRQPGHDYPDLERLSMMVHRGVGGEIAGEYRLERTPQTSGDAMVISPSAVGLQALLADDESASMIFIDRDLSHWGANYGKRQLELLTSGYNPDAGSFEASPGSFNQTTGVFTPATLRTSIGRLSQSGGLGGAGVNSAICEVLYNAGPGNNIASIRADIISSSLGSGWAVSFYLCADEDINNAAGAFIGFTPGPAQVDAPSYPRQAALIQMLYGGAFTGDNDWYQTYANLRIIGNHGLPVVGGAADQGVYASDVVRYAVQRWASKLKVTPDSIAQSMFVIPQLAFAEPTTAAEMISQVVRFELLDWWVGANQIFYCQPRTQHGKRWRTRIAPAQFEETGPQADKLYNSVIVPYSDVDGTTKTVGPPGSGADYESAELVDTDPENPCNQLGITRRKRLPPTGILGTNAAGVPNAVVVGKAYLDEQKRLDRSGRARLVGVVEDEHGVLYPAWRVQAGDQIAFIDAAFPGYRRITKADYDHGSRTVNMDLDSPPESLAAFLELVGVGIGAELGL